MPALCSGLSLRSSPEHSASPSLYLAQQAATDGPELTATSGPRLLAKLKNKRQRQDKLFSRSQVLWAYLRIGPLLLPTRRRGELYAWSRKRLFSVSVWFSHLTRYRGQNRRETQPEGGPVHDLS